MSKKKQRKQTRRERLIWFAEDVLHYLEKDENWSMQTMSDIVDSALAHQLGKVVGENSMFKRTKERRKK